FVDALAALIASAASGSLATMIAASPEGWQPSIEVFAFTRATRGRIRVAGLPNGLTASVEYIPAPAPIKPGRAKKGSRGRIALANDAIGDLERSGRITEVTILPIARLLAEEARK